MTSIVYNRKQCADRKIFSKRIKNLDQNEKSGFGLPPDSSVFGGKPNALLALFQKFFPNPLIVNATIFSTFHSDISGQVQLFLL